MAISCEPADLASAAKCYACLSAEERELVKIYLYAVIAAKDDLTAAQLVAAAKCYGCIPPPVRAAVEAYLLCQAANGGEAPAAECAMLTGDGDPSGVETPDFEGQLYHDTTGDTWWYSTGTTSADWTEIPVGGTCENVEGVGAPT